MFKGRGPMYIIHNTIPTTIKMEISDRRDLDKITTIKTEISDSRDLDKITTIKTEISDEKPAKKKVCRLSLAEKTYLIEDHKTKKMKVADLAKKYDVSIKTVRRTISEKESIKEKVENLKKFSGDPAKLKKYSTVYNSPFEGSLYAWLMQKRNLNQSVSISLLKARAKMMHTHFRGEAPFRASDGWVHKFKKRHGLVGQSTKGEILSPALKTAEGFGNALADIIEEHGYNLDNIYNADETALLWKMLPDNNIAGKCEIDVHGMKAPKDQVTLQVAANASGTHKVTLTMIGKANLPQCFRQVGLENLPLIYMSQAKGWMSRKVFTDWYTTVFLPSIKKNNPDPKAKFLLLVDNAPSHPPLEELNLIDSQCTVMYLPPNITSVVQPMNQGVISELKRRYKMFFLNELYGESLQTTWELIQFLNNWSLFECSDILASAWDLVSQSTLTNAWNKLLPPHLTTSVASVESVSLNTAPSIVSRLPGCQKITIKEAETWIDADNDFFPWKPYSDEEIYKIANQEPIEYNDEEQEELAEKDEDHTFQETPISTTDLLLCVSHLQLWARNHAGLDRSIFNALNLIKDKLVQSRSIAPS